MRLQGYYEPPRDRGKALEPSSSSGGNVSDSKHVRRLDDVPDDIDDDDDLSFRDHKVVAKGTDRVLPTTTNYPAPTSAPKSDS
jgi:hypothetical protein